MPVLFDAPGLHRWITVAESSGVRYLYLDGCEEGAMRLDGDDPVFDYVWFYKCTALAAQPVRRALVLGAGSFAAARGLALDYPQADILVLDNEPQLEQLGREFFRLDRLEFSRVSFQAQAAEEFLRTAAPIYDFVFDDVFASIHCVPIACCNLEHFHGLRRCLAPGGVCLKNLVWDPNIPESRTACTEAAAALQQVFPCHAVLLLGNSAAGHNLLLLGLNRNGHFDWDALQIALTAAGLPDQVLKNSQVARDHQCLSAVGQDSNPDRPKSRHDWNPDPRAT